MFLFQNLNLSLVEPTYCLPQFYMTANKPNTIKIKIMIDSNTFIRSMTLNVSACLMSSHVRQHEDFNLV